MLEIFESIDLMYYNITDEITESETYDFGLNLTDKAGMTMTIDTRPTYPSSKLTFTIADVAKNKAIRFFNIYLTSPEQFDVDVVLEDSKRKFLNSFISLFIFCLLNSWNLLKFWVHIVIFQFYQENVVL